jgi:hypothetical protein
LKFTGELHFQVIGPGGEAIEDSYAVELRIPPSFPTVTRNDAPTAREMAGRIPKTYHKLEDGSLCLAAPTELRLGLGEAATLCDFVEGFVIPYLYGYSSFVRGGGLPYGELEHGTEGLRQYFASLFGVSDRDAALEFVRLASLKKRVANKEPCPCGKRKRLGRCHHRLVNKLREQLGRGWFAAEYDRAKRSSPARPIERVPHRPSKRRRHGKALRSRQDPMGRPPSSSLPCGSRGRRAPSVPARREG